MEISVSVSSLKHWESSSRSSCIWKWKWIAFSWLWWLKVTKKQLIKEKQQHYLPVIFNIFPGLLFFVWGLRVTSLLQHCLLHLHTNLLALCLIQEPKIICGVRNDSRILVLSRRKLFPQSSCVIVSLQWLNSNKTTLFFSFFSSWKWPYKLCSGFCVLLLDWCEYQLNRCSGKCNYFVSYPETTRATQKGPTLPA